MIYTDIEAPADKKFNDQYPRPDRDNILNDDDRIKLAQSGSFPTGLTETKKIRWHRGGRLGKLGGSLMERLTACRVHTSAGWTWAGTLVTDADGDLVKSENWGFRAKLSAATVKDPDVAYTYFGWWLNKPKDNDDPHYVEVFTGGHSDGGYHYPSHGGYCEVYGPGSRQVCDQDLHCWCADRSWSWALHCYYQPDGKVR